MNYLITAAGKGSRFLQKGIKQIRTDNEENNPMYKINIALGFSPVPSSLEYTKEI